MTRTSTSVASPRHLLVVGGGMVGAAVACLLARAGLRITLFEPQVPAAFDPAQALDRRVSAISPAAVALLQRCQAWEAVLAMRACPYKRLETWESPRFATRFHADELGLAELGFIVENRVIQLALWQQLTAMDNVTLVSDAGALQLVNSEQSVSVSVADGRAWSGDLLLAADGAHSAMRQQAGIGVTEWDYPQRCMLINVDTEVAQQDITWQQFYPTGPRAFLPLPGAHASLVWYDSPARIRALQQLPLPQLETAIRQAFPDCLPGIKVTGADSFALTRRHAQRYVAGRVVLLGDAAHTIHPLAGQGVNLGFRDVATLVDLLVPAAASDDEPWLAQLSRYQHQRRRDNLLMQSAMDLFCATFSNDLPPLRLLRNLGLGVAQHAGPLKRQALRYALGLTDLNTVTIER